MPNMPTPPRMAVIGLFCAALAFRPILAEGVSMPVLKTTLPASWDESWFGSPVVFDLDGDGSKEIIASRHSVLYVWDAAGKILWRAAVGKDGVTDEVHGGDRQYSGPVVGDLDGDGKGDIAIAYGNHIAVYDWQGKVRGGWPQTFPGAAGEIRSLAAADLDKDGKAEIIAVKSATGPTTAAYSLAGVLLPGWPQAKDCPKCNDYGGFNQNVGAADLDGDGIPEVVATFDEAYIGIMHADGKPSAADISFAKAGPWASSVPMFHDLALAQQGFGADGNDRDEFTDSPPSFADLDGDGKPEIILYSNHEKAGDTAALGNCLWALHGDMTRVKGFEKPLCSDTPIFTGYYNNVVETAPAPVIANLSGDARPEIVVASNDGNIRGFSAEGAELWKYGYDVKGEPWIQASEPVVGDLNNDGSPEIVFTTYSVDQGVSHLTILDAMGKMQRKAPLDKRGSMGAPTLADADGDGKIDILISLKDVVGGSNGGVQIWTVATAGANKPLWPTGRGNYLRTGVAGGATLPVPLRYLRAWHGIPIRAVGYDALGIPFGIPAQRPARLLLFPAP